MDVKGDIWGWVVRGSKSVSRERRISSHDVYTIIHDYGARLGGALYLYVPEPPVDQDAMVHDMLEVFVATNTIAEQPYFKEAERVHDRVRTLKPRLFEHDPPFFRIHRVNENRLQELATSLDRR